MRIKANRGRIFGAELKDRGAAGFRIQRRAHGARHGQRPDPGFPALHRREPGGGSINHFTDPFRVEGVGSLDLQLVLPLARIEASRVKGEYHFARNALQVDPALPVFADAAGGWPSPRASWW
jgi:hypothetical protein